MKSEKIRFLYFSPTHSCKAICESLSHAFACELLDLTAPDARDQAPRSFGREEWLIIAFPVYAKSVPRPFAAYLSKLKAQGTPVTLLSVYGNVTSGCALGQGMNILKKRGFRILSGAEIPAAHSYNCSQVQIAPGEPSAETLKACEALIAHSAAKLERGSWKEADIAQKKSVPVPQTLPVRFALKLPKRRPSLCDGCGRCRRACPVGAIGPDLQIRPKKCIRCLACVKTCPVGARKIEFRNPIPIWFLNHFGKGKKEPQFFL